MDQLRAIDNKRLIDGPLVRLGDDLLKRVCLAVAEVLEESSTVLMKF